MVWEWKMQGKAFFNLVTPLPQDEDQNIKYIHLNASKYEEIEMQF